MLDKKENWHRLQKDALLARFEQEIKSLQRINQWDGSLPLSSRGFRGTSSARECSIWPHRGHEMLMKVDQKPSLAAREFEVELERLSELLERGAYGEAKALAHALHRRACWLSNTLDRSALNSQQRASSDAD